MADQNTIIQVPSYRENLDSEGHWIRTDTGNDIVRVILKHGTNNKDLRPCSPYTAEYESAPYGINGRAYEIRDGKWTLTEISVGAQRVYSYPSKLIREGSLEDAQRALYGQTLNVAMTAKDLIDANKMACDWFKRMSKAAPFLRKKQWGRAYRAFFGNKSISKNACNSWLEFQFGVMPTKMAVQEAYTTYAKGHVPGRSVQVNGVPSCLRLIARSREEYVQEDSDEYFTYSSGSQCMRYQCIRYLSKEDITQALYRFNLVEVAWDATPWSFAVDWFIPVGDWLKQFGYLTTTQCDGCDTSDWTVSVHGRTNYHTDSFRVEQIFDYDLYTMHRSQNATLEYTMSLSEMLNKSSVGLSCKRAVSAFSLCRQRFSGRGWW